MILVWPKSTELIKPRKTLGLDPLLQADKINLLVSELYHMMYDDGKTSSSYHETLACSGVIPTAKDIQLSRSPTFAIG